jgi:hypothetical protein
MGAARRITPRSGPSATKSTRVAWSAWLKTHVPSTAEPAGPVELGELDDLNELPRPGRLGPLPHPVPLPGLAVAQHFDPRLRRLPIAQIGGVRHVVEHRLGRTRHGEHLLEAHRCSVSPCDRAGRLYLALGPRVYGGGSVAREVLPRPAATTKRGSEGRL